ncbi:hypothetical protein ALQ93_102363 [Pseudomonas syringae pv. pisi]|nr:hypothetical protein ALQ93_102363 [Pseudomonas syringae pv. pisi]
MGAIRQGLFFQALNGLSGCRLVARGYRWHRVCAHLEHTHSGRLGHLRQDVCVPGHRARRNAGECCNRRSHQCLALVLELTARGPDLRFCGFVPQFMSALGRQALPFGKGQAAIELHGPSVAAAITGVAIPCPAAYGFNRGAYRRQRQVFRKPLL